MKPRGTFTVTPFKNPNKTTSYRVTGTALDGTRVRENLKTHPEALARKQQLEIEALNTETEKRITATRLTPAQEAEAERAFADLAGRPLMQAVRFYLDNYHEPLRKVTLGVAYTEFLAAKKASGLREASLKGLKTRVGFLVKKFSGNLVSDLLPTHIAEAAAQPGVSEGTKEDNRRSFSSFFSWCMEMQYCQTNPAKKTVRRRGHSTRDDVEPAIMNLEDVRRMLVATLAYKDGKLIPYVALALFAAIRPTELARLTWENIDLEAGVITIGAKMAKMRQRRIVDMVNVGQTLEISKKGGKANKTNEAVNVANLMEWLRPFAATKPPFRGPNWRKDFDAVKLSSGFCTPDKKTEGDRANAGGKQSKQLKIWTPDILRHTGISNHLAFLQHEGKTAAWAGNSPDIIQRHYKGLIRFSDAREFWTLKPSEFKETTLV